MFEYLEHVIEVDLVHLENPVRNIVIEVVVHVIEMNIVEAKIMMANTVVIIVDAEHCFFHISNEQHRRSGKLFRKD